MGEEIIETLLASQRRIGVLVGRAAMIADASSADAAAAGPYVVRGLTLAFAVHVCDHGDSLVPRLRARCPVLDGALEVLVEEHRRALDFVKRLRVALDWIRSAPDEPVARDALHGVVLPLGYLFIASFAREEDVVFPAIRTRLSPDEQRTIAREMRMRRARSTSARPARQPNGSIGERDGAAEQP